MQKAKGKRQVLAGSALSKSFPRRDFDLRLLGCNCKKCHPSCGWGESGKIVFLAELIATPNRAGVLFLKQSEVLPFSLSIQFW